MPAKRKSTSGTPDPAEPVAAEPTSESDEAEDEAESQPLNRAERRARGKGGQQAQPTSRGKVVGQHGPAQAHRNWANRRSG